MKKDASERFLEWSEKIKEQKLSNKSEVTWCREQGLSFYTFQYWKKKINQKIYKTPKKNGFIEFSEDCPLIEISLRGVKLEISKDFDRSGLLFLLNLLRSESC